MDQAHNLFNFQENVDTELVLDVCELSVCLGNYTHDVYKTTKILAKHLSAPLDGSTERKLLAKFQQRFKHLKRGEVNGYRLIQLYKELKHLGQDNHKGVQYLTLFTELFDFDRPKLKARKKSRSFMLVKDLRFNNSNLLSRPDAGAECCGSFLNNVSSENLKTEATTTISVNINCNCRNEQMQIEDYKRIQEGVAEIKSLKKSKKYKLRNFKDFRKCKPETLGKRLNEVTCSDFIMDRALSLNYIYTCSTVKNSLNIPAYDFDGVFGNISNESADAAKNYLVNHKLRRKKTICKYISKKDALGDHSVQTPNHNNSINLNKLCLDEEYEAERESTEKCTSLGRAPEYNSRNNFYAHRKHVQGFGYTVNVSDIIRAPEKQNQTGQELSGLEIESSLDLHMEQFEKSEDVKDPLSQHHQELRQALTSIKTNILKRIDKSLSVLSLNNQSEDDWSVENDKDVDVLNKNHPDNFEHGKIIIKRKQRSERKVHWQHQQHMIIAPCVVIQLFKCNPAYKSPAEARNFFDQVNQLFEIIGEKNANVSLPLDVRCIQLRLIKMLHEIKRELPRNISFARFVAAVAKCQLNQLLSPKEMRAYESLCRHLRKNVCGMHRTTEESRFRGALSAMVGLESEHLKASAVTGRLQIRSPHHQESVSESYLLLTMGLLGYLYNRLNEQMNSLEKRGETAACLVQGLRNSLLAFQEFLERRQNKPCSLLCLYWETRKYQLLMQWLLKLLAKINQNEGIIMSLYQESSRRIGEQRRLILKLLAEASKPLISRLNSWLSLGQLIASDKEDFIIERNLNSTSDDFWQESYQLTAPFSKLFNSQLSEMLISVGKTMAYSKKFLGRNVETPMSSTGLNRKLICLFAQFYRHGDQEPLYNYLYQLDSYVSGKVLGSLNNLNPSPMVLFYQMHKYLMLTDIHFHKELLEILGVYLDEPASTFNSKFFDTIIHQMLPRQTADIYVDKSVSQGSKCWSCFLLRLRLPDYWRALLGEDMKEYEDIFPGLWKFHYANYVLSEIVTLRMLHLKKRSKDKYFDDIDQVDKGLETLLDLFLDAMSVLKNYFLKDLLEPAYIQLRLDCDEANSLDDMLNANRSYLHTIRQGSFKTKSLRRCNMYLEQLYDGIMDLIFQEQKFFRFVENFVDFLSKYGGKTSRMAEIPVPSYELADRRREFRWCCQNSIDAFKSLKDRFHMTMFDLLFNLYSADIKAFKILAQELDRNGYYKQMDKRLQNLKRFERKRRMLNRTL